MNESEAERTLEPLLPSRVLLLGAGGFIGSAVVARLAAERVGVRAVVRRAAQALELPHVEWRVVYLKRFVDPNRRISKASTPS
jgi:nucleoside-diphosphate-sugar epimerase